MAYLICIAEGTYREGINKLDDIVDVLDDEQVNTDIYSTFRLIHVEGKAADIRRTLEAKQPKNETIQRWQDPKTLERYRLEQRPKHILTATAVNDKATTEEKLAAIVDNITTDETYKKDKVAITTISTIDKG